jgi:hypothetical protein
MNIAALKRDLPSPKHDPRNRASASHQVGQPESLSDMIGEELLLLAIAGRPGDRRRIDQELELRALLAHDSRRVRSTTRLRLRRAPSRAA